MSILIGCDPELFVRNPNSREFISAHDMIDGTKEHPQLVTDGMIQVDGTALEFGIDPASTEDEFVNRINSVRQTLRDKVDPGYEIVNLPTATFDATYFKSLPLYAKLLGCTPDFNAWSGLQNVSPDGKGPTRAAGGHIHIGWTSGKDVTGKDKEHWDTCQMVAQQMDYYLGIWSLLWDKDDVRRTMYGKAGAFRVKPYGVEYRTLSNAWLTNDLLMRWVYRAAKRGTEELLFNNNKAAHHYGDTAQYIIDNNEDSWMEWSDIDLGLVAPPTPRMVA